MILTVNSTVRQMETNSEMNSPMEMPKVKSSASMSVSRLKESLMG